MKITRRDIYCSEHAYVHHTRAETWKNAIWSINHVMAHRREGGDAFNVLLRAFRANMRYDRKDAIRAAMRAKGGAA